VLLNEGRCILDSLGLPLYEHLPLATVFRRDRLLEAKRKYQDGLNFAMRDEHKAEAERGLFLVSMELLDEKSDPETCEVYDLYKQAMRHASSAICLAVQANLGPTWIWSVKCDAFEAVKEFCKKDDHECNARYFARLESEVFSNAALGWDCSNHIAEVRYIILHAIVLQRFETAVKCLSLLDHSGCMNELSESSRALREGTALIPPRFQFFSGATTWQRRELQWLGDIPASFKVLEKDIRLHQNISNAGMMIKQGNIQIRAACAAGEFDNQLVLLAMDNFKQAIIDAGSGLGCDLEWLHEAWANARLGHVYSKIRKEPAIGSKYYKQCLFVAFAIKRRTFEHEPWFREANVEAQSYQQQNILRDQEAVATRREPFLRQLRNE
jgi:hypothetical protein